MNRKSRYGIAAAIVASSVIAASAAYAVAGGDGTRPVPAFHARVTVPTNTENGHVSVNPCRAVDTRHGGGAIATAHSRTFSITGTNLSSQGGSATGCGIPIYAAAVTVNATVTGGSGGGYITLYPGGAPKPATSTVNWAGAGTTLANGATIKLSSSGTLSVYTSKGTQVIIDVTGYDAPPIYGIINDATSATAPTLFAGTTRLGALTYNSPGYYSITAVGVNADCASTAVLESGNGTADAVALTNIIYVRTYNQAGTIADLGHFIDITVRC